MKLKSWTEPVTLQMSVDFYKDQALLHAQKAGRHSAELVAAIRKDDLKFLCNHRIEYRDRESAIELYHARQATAFFSKLEDLEIGLDKEGTARATWEAAERKCRETNEIFDKWKRGEFKFLPAVDAVLSDAAYNIARVLGPVPSYEKLNLRFGKGATTKTIKRLATKRQKLSDGMACSEDLLRALGRVLPHLTAWTRDLSEVPCKQNCSSEPLVIVGSCTVFTSDTLANIAPDFGDGPDMDEFTVHCVERFPLDIDDEHLSFVAKNAKTYRATSTQPSLNLMVQLGYGDYMTRRLARFGLDLKDQSLNQILAKQGSLTGDLATLDLSSASDMIAIELVYHLLPVDWAIALSEARCSYVVIDGGRRKLEKFSAMGNGFTFPLESLIFWALAQAVSGRNSTVSVYGDDIIVPSDKFEDLSEVLNAVGFSVNREKSFHQGSFRESCGTDWYRGVNIRPFYAKHLVAGDSLYLLHNYYVRTGQFDEAQGVLSHIPQHLRQFGPDGIGDGVLLSDDYPRLRPNRVSSNGHCGYLVKVNSHTSAKDVSPESQADYCHALYSAAHRSVSAHCPNLDPSRGFLRLGRNYRHYQFLLKCGEVGRPIPFQKERCTVKGETLPGTTGSKLISTYVI